MIIGRGCYGYNRDSAEDVLNTPIPPPPIFEEDMETIRARVTTMVNKAPLPKKYGDKPHHLIAKLLEADQARSQEKQTPWGLLERACIQHAV